MFDHHSDDVRRSGEALPTNKYTQSLVLVNCQINKPKTTAAISVSMAKKKNTIKKNKQTKRLHLLKKVIFNDVQHAL